VKYLACLGVMGLMAILAGSAQADTLTVLQAGGDRLIATQNTDGGWGWPVTGVSAPNTIGPIGMGLSTAYSVTGDSTFRTGLQKVGTYMLTKSGNFSPSDGYLAVELDRVFGGTTYSDYVKANFYDKLAAGTYMRIGVGDSTLYDTAAYVNRIRTVRSGTQANMAAWDIGVGLYAAAKIGADTTAWADSTRAEVNELDSDNYYDPDGMAGAILGLAAIGDTSFDPTSGSHASAANLHDLASQLLTLQINNGGISWSKDWVIPNDGDECTQATAYSILALAELDKAGYQSQLDGMGAWLRSTQLGNGGFENYTTYGENNEVTAEALWGAGVAPEPATLALLGLGGGLALLKRRRNRN
jgi:hypothetical protein